MDIRGNFCNDECCWVIRWHFCSQWIQHIFFDSPFNWSIKFFSHSCYPSNPPCKDTEGHSIPKFGEKFVPKKMFFWFLKLRCSNNAVVYQVDWLVLCLFTFFEDLKHLTSKSFFLLCIISLWFWVWGREMLLAHLLTGVLLFCDQKNKVLGICKNADDHKAEERL